MTWRRAFIVMIAAFAATESFAQPQVPWTAEEKALLATDARQRDAVASGDPGRVTETFHPNALVNAPSNRVMSRDEVARMVASGEIRNDSWERVPERVSVSGDVGVVMGHEALVTVAGSEQAQLYGAGRRLERRFTNVYIRSDGAWRLFARHAHVLPPPPPGASR